MESVFLKADFHHIELSRMARLRSGSLALIFEAFCIDDQIWDCKGGIVPFVLRPNIEMIG